MSFSFRIESYPYTGLGESRSRIQSRLGLRYCTPEPKSAKAQESVRHLRRTINEPAGITGIADERETAFLAERIMKKKGNHTCTQPIYLALWMRLCLLHA
ncbi:hypothetical protein SAMN05216332_1089 [Nitrosospira briensis]|nr:hypothetical protein SAMN05216332_1089 [Nitrosospira briensis]